MRCPPPSHCSKASRRRPARGKPSCCRRASPRYEPAWLDDQCLAGRIAWARLSPCAGRANGRERAVTPVRTTPITLLARRHAAFWTSLSGSAEDIQPSRRAQTVLDCLRSQGASFFDELVEAAGLLRPQIEEALAELVALGLVNSDSFGGLRALLVPSDRRKPFAAGVTRRRRTLTFGMEDAGRWALTRRAPSDANAQQTGAGAIEHVARTLLRRYGVVFWRLLAREADWLPPWRDLLRVYRRLEARGEIRGGRFVAGFSGEQYALPEAIGALREARRQPASGEWVSLSGADPLNLAGILTPGPRLAGLDRQPAAVPRRRACRLAGRRRGAVSRHARSRQPVGSAQEPVAFGYARGARRPGLIEAGMPGMQAIAVAAAGTHPPGTSLVSNAGMFTSIRPAKIFSSSNI